MTMNVAGRKASLYATAMAISLVALSGTAHAQSLNGTYKTGSAWDLAGAAPTNNAIPDTRTEAEKAKAAAEFAVRESVVSQLPILSQTSTAAVAYKNALAVEAAAPALAAAAAANVLRSEAAKNAADVQAGLILAQKSSADSAKTAALARQSAAATALAAATTPTATTAATAAKAKADAEVILATQKASVLLTAYNVATSDASVALVDYTTAIGAKATADANVQLAVAARITKASELNTAINSDAGFLAALPAVNAAAGTNFTATYEGLNAIAAYAGEDPSLPVFYGNGYEREVSILAASAASNNQAISLASGALTESAAALAVGANYETEVLNALVDHEGRIVTNTNAITAETAARIAADTAESNARIAEDKRIVGLVSAETTARLAQNAELRDRIASSTATAIALGGAALLPDMGFTLSGNVAFYEGAQAMALNAAAKVGPNAYVTAAVGGGLNKHGSVGGRIGFVFGF